MEREVANDPVFPEPYLKLAKLHREEGRVHDALKVLKRGQEALGSGDLKIAEALEEIHIAAARQQLAVAEKRAKTEDTDEARELVQKLKADLNRIELQVFADRANRHPDDKRVRLELGHRLKRAGNFEEALAELEIAASEPIYAAGAELIRGECFQQLKQYKPAIQAYQKSLAAEGAPEIRQLALYRAGVLAAGLKQAEAAEKWLAELVGQNPDFRDARARLDKIRSIRDSG